MASGYMFSHYWPGDGAGPQQPTGLNPYPHWQAAILTAGLLVLLWV